MSAGEWILDPVRFRAGAQATVNPHSVAMGIAAGGGINLCTSKYAASSTDGRLGRAGQVPGMTDVKSLLVDDL